MNKVPVGYQVYSARELAEKDMEKVFAALKEMGYDGVEFAGFYGKTAAEVKDILDRTGLVAVSSHVGYDLLCNDLDSIIAYHLEIGCKYIAVPYLDEAERPDGQNFADVIRNLYAIGKKCKDNGITLLYHNHDFEFVQVNGIYGLDFLYRAVSEEFLQTEIDTCWVKYAGEDPAAYVRKYAGRAPIVHLKDYVGVKGEGTPYELINRNAAATSQTFEFRPVGHGCQDVVAVVEAGIEAGAKWFVVEQDRWYDRCPLEAARMSIETLKKIGLKG